MSEHPTTPPLDGAELTYVMATAASAYINAIHPDLPPLRWIPNIDDGGMLGVERDDEGKTPEELSALAEAWAQRLGLEPVDTYSPGRVRYVGRVDTVGRVAVGVTTDPAAYGVARAEHEADLDARKADRQIAAEAGGR